MQSWFLYLFTTDSENQNKDLEEPISYLVITSFNCNISDVSLTTHLIFYFTQHDCIWIPQRQSLSIHLTADEVGHLGFPHHWRYYELPSNPCCHPGLRQSSRQPRLQYGPWNLLLHYPGSKCKEYYRDLNGIVTHIDSCSIDSICQLKVCSC